MIELIHPRLNGCRLVFTTVDEGNLATHTVKEKGTALNNIAHFEQLIGRQVQWLNQIHGTEVHTVKSSSLCTPPPTADAQSAVASQLALGILTADCLPVIFYCADKQQIAVAHAGWRGLVHGVLTNTLASFADPARVFVVLGPCIQPPHYQVDQRVFNEAIAVSELARDAFIEDGEGFYQFDLLALATRQLIAAGVQDIHNASVNTFRDNQFYSYRRGDSCDRFATVVWCES